MPRLELVLVASPADALYGAVLADALRATGARIWSEPFDLQDGQLPQVVEKEVRHCPVFLILLSPTAKATPAVREVCAWASYQARRSHLPAAQRPGCSSH